MSQLREQIEPVEPIRWYHAIYNALARPSVSQYQKLAANPNAKRRTAYTWVGISSVLAVMGLVEVSTLISYRQLGITPSVRDLVSMLVQSFVLAIVIAFANLCAFWLFVFVQHKVAGGQNGNIVQLTYVQAAVFAPILIVVITLATYLPAVLVLVIPFGLYSLIAAHAIYKRGWLRSIVSVFLALVASGTLLLAAGIAIATAFLAFACLSGQCV